MSSHDIQLFRAVFINYDYNNKTRKIVISDKLTAVGDEPSAAH